MALTPMIVIGCGGSGGKVVVSLRERLEVELRRRGWTEGIPDAWQLLYIDTPSAQESNPDYGRVLHPGDYISTSGHQTSYAPIDEALGRHAEQHDALDRLTGWRPAHDQQVPVSTGAGQWRAVGRAVAFHGLKDVADRVRRALNSCQSGRSQLQRLGEMIADEGMPDTTPFVVVVSSMAGGTGAGIFIDVCDVVRAVEPDLNDRIMSVLFTAEVFQDLKGGTGLQPNTVGVLSEMMAGYFDRNRSIEPLYTGLVDVRQHELTSSGPAYPFVLGMSTLEGTTLGSISDCYRAATETLASAMMSPRVYKDLLEFQITNWSNNALPNMSAWEFGNPAYGSGTRRPAGSVSSFGSSRLSVGTVLFGEYAAHRMTRELVEFLVDGYLDEGRQLLQDSTATREEVLRYFRTDRGLAFVETCGLRELNDDGVEHDQVLEAILPSLEITDSMRSWVSSLKGELAVIGSASKAQWINAIGDTVPNRVSHVVNPALQRIDRSVSELAACLPDRVVAETSRLMSELGVPVASELLGYTAEHVEASITQLRNEATEERQASMQWREAAGRALVELQERDRVDVEHPLVGGPGGAITQATRYGYNEIRAIARERTADFLERFLHQVLQPLRSHVDQIVYQLADPEVRARVAKYPAETGVPMRFAPTPLDHTLIDVDEWPQLYERLVGETARAEIDPNFASTNAGRTYRRMIGGGGFTVQAGGRPTQVGSALELQSNWSLDRAVAVRSSLTIEDLMNRTREWLGRTDTAIGGFIHQDLDRYLAPLDASGGAVLDHPARISRFRDQLSAAIASATPLVAIDPNVFDRVHPNSTMRRAMTTLDVQPLPLSGAARVAAEHVLQAQIADAANKDIDEYFTDGTEAGESVLIVSQLAGAVHPSAVQSLTGPVAAAWGQTKVTPQTVDAFWQYRRARILPEFVPVAPNVLNSLIKGYFVGRAFGAIPDPEAHGKLLIGDQGSKVAFPWPLLRWGQIGDRLLSKEHQRDWLPALLESLSLAYMLVPTQPDVLDGYEAMYRIGINASQRMEAWISVGQIPETIDTSRVAHSGDRDAAVAALYDALTLARDQYQARIESTTLSADPNSFYTAEFGHSLYPAIVAALGELIREIPSPDASEMAL